LAWFRRVKVSIDGEKVGGLREGETVVVALDLGPHVVRFQMDWVHRARIEFLNQEGGDTRIVVSAAWNELSASLVEPTSNT
jgi:hypothetical protein